MYCSVPPSEAQKEFKLMEEIVTAECCPETLLRVKESGGRVVCESALLTYTFCFEAFEAWGGGRGRCSVAAP